MSGFMIGTPRRSQKSLSSGKEGSPVQSPPSVTGLFSRSESPSSPDSPSRRFPNVKRVPKNAVGSLWSAELACLQNVRSSFEAAQTLRRMEELLQDVDKVDRLKFCKADFVCCVAMLRQNPIAWTTDIIKIVIHLSQTYFDQHSFSKMSHCVMMAVLLWLPIKEFAAVACLSKEWQTISSASEIWRQLFFYKFLRTNTIYDPSRPLVIEGSYKSAFKARLFDPHVGDKVEVAWSGKFRLEGADVYQGSAWWVAEVVDKHSAVERYKIRYPGWDRRWDEWVPKSKLRWAVERNTVAALHVRDRVEIWCCGASVPGAWLESKIYKVKNGRYCVGKVVSSGPLWVERDRLRPAAARIAMVASSEDTQDSNPTQPAAVGDDEDEQVNDSTSQRRIRRRTLWNRVRSFVGPSSPLRRSVSLSFSPNRFSNRRAGRERAASFNQTLQPDGNNNQLQEVDDQDIDGNDDEDDGSVTVNEVDHTLPGNHRRYQVELDSEVAVLNDNNRNGCSIM